MTCLHASKYLFYNIYFVNPGPMSLRRARRSQRHRDVQSFVSPIEVLDYSRENIDESLPQNIKNTSEKMVCLYFAVY